MLWKECKIKKVDLERRLCFNVVLTGVQLIKAAAQIAQRAFRPIHVIRDLHFKVYVYIVVQQNSDIEDEIFVINMFSKYDGIGDDNRCDF